VALEPFGKIDRRGRSYRPRVVSGRRAQDARRIPVIVVRPIGHGAQRIPARDLIRILEQSISVGKPP
jgi:hypothetical protein